MIYICIRQLRETAMTQEIQILLLEKLVSKLEDVGIVADMSISKSKTNFGYSTYLYVGPFKIRASDHSTGLNRMMEEYPLFSHNFNEIFETVERYYFSERYEEIKSLEFGNEHEANDNKIKGLEVAGIEYEVVKPNIRKSKKGSNISIIRVRNQEKTTFVKK